MSCLIIEKLKCYTFWQVGANKTSSMAGFEAQNIKYLLWYYWHLHRLRKWSYIYYELLLNWWMK